MSITDRLLHQGVTKTNLKIRRARFEDAELLWQWANDPEVRANSFHPEKIPMHKHLEWYEAKLSSSNTRIWILELNGEPAAQIRYDCIDVNTAEIGFSVARTYRGRGLGIKILTLTVWLACRELNTRWLKSVVFSSNEISKRVFVKAGFKFLRQEKISGKLCHVFLWQCPKVEEGRAWQTL